VAAAGETRSWTVGVGAEADAVATGAGTWSWIVGTGADALAVAAGGETVWFADAANGGLRLM